MKHTTYDIRLTTVIVFLLVFSLVGCDAFVRKFTRKPKKDVSEQELVLVPEEYNPEMDREGKYRKSLMYWKYWQEELINSLIQGTSHKKKVNCIEQAIKSLEEIRPMLDPEMQKKLDTYIQEEMRLREAIIANAYTYLEDDATNGHRAEDIKRRVLRDFSFNKIQGGLI